MKMDSSSSSSSSSSSEKERCVRVLCRKIVISKEAGLQWLIGSPFFPQLTIISSFRCLHYLSNDPFSPDYSKEADDLRTLLLRGFDIIGALYVNDNNWEINAYKAAKASRNMRRLIFNYDWNGDMIGAASDLVTGDIQLFVCGPGQSQNLKAINTVIYEDYPEKFVWGTGCLLRCELTIKLPIYVPINRPSEAEKIFSSAIDAAAAKLKDPQAAYMVEMVNEDSQEVSQPILLRGGELDFHADLSGTELLENTDKESVKNTIPCSYFASKNQSFLPFTSRENADAIQVTFLFNQSRNSLKPTAPIAEYFPEPARLLVVSLKLEVLCYASKSLPVASAVSKLIIPGLLDQFAVFKKAVLPSFLKENPQLRPYHFFPQGMLHPITTIYELTYGEMEMQQVEIRRSLHLRLGLPLDRPLLLTVNALNFGSTKGNKGSSTRNGFPLLKDVHTKIPGSGVSGGLVSLVEGSYEYHHYLQDGFDDSGWGCAYRSLQTIISWFKLQQYASIEVPSHREIQQALVEIGDKEPSFIGSREWIGAIELSFVLDKLLGVSCKIINVRSGAELPEKCRALALHFETQGTPVMIGGGVLAYTLLGVDYNDVSGDCAFLILDPHYTGTDELKKIVNGGWCGWKKAVDSKGRNFFLHDKFYNLLLPQRPNMV